MVLYFFGCIAAIATVIAGLSLRDYVRSRNPERKSHDASSGV